MSDALPKFVLTCMHPGPLLTSSRDDDELDETFCTLEREHADRHQWWADDGTVMMEWDDDWKLGEGRWREVMQ